MPGLVPGIHVFGVRSEDVVGRDKPGHDEKKAAPYAIALRYSGAIQSIELFCAIAHLRISRFPDVQLHI